MIKSTFKKRLTSAVMAMVLLVSFIPFAIFLNLAPIKASAADNETVVDPVDYIAGKYDGVDTGHVFESVTYERLVRILRTDGNHIVVLSSPGNATSQASLKYINETAKAYGVQKIYQFDPHLAEGTGLYGVDITQPGSNPATPYGKFWTTLKTFTTGATGGALLKYIDESFTSSDTDLIVYNRKGTGSDLLDGKDTIRGELLIKQEDADEIASDIDGFKTQVENVFSAVGPIGNTNESRLTNYDFFKLGFASANPSIDDSIAKAGGTVEDFPLVSVTLSELLYILDQPGTHNFLVTGTWCPDSRMASPYIVENAIRYSKGTPIYVFDFRLDGNLAGGSSLTLSTNETATTYTGTGYVGQLINEKLGPYNVGQANTFRTYYPEGDITEQLATKTNKNFRSPYLFQYDKSAKDSDGNAHPVTKEWIHQLADYERPWHANAVIGEYPEGAYIDYELYSGELNNAQKALGRAKLATYFGAPAIASGHKTTITVNEDPDSEDNGCGDDNDPIDNIGDTVLIPNHGTYSYDVQDYDINVEFVPSNFDNKDAFIGKTVITAITADRLNEISLDFRRQALTATPTVKKVTIGTDGTVTEGESVAVSDVERINIDDQDKQKLNIKLGSYLEKNQAFQVTVEYTTGLIDTFVALGESPQGFARSLYGTGAAAIGEPFGATYWFPTNNAPHDGATYKVTLIAPSSYASVSAGLQVSNTNDFPSSGKRTRVYEVTKQTAPYQLFASFNSAYSEFTQTITLLDGTEIPAVSYYPTALYASNDNRARDKIDTLYNKTAYIIRELEKIIGKYPGKSAGFVFDNLSNGNGEPATWGAVETQSRPFFTSSNITSETTFVHEYVHQWFGDAVRIADWKSLWLNEGFATYVTDMYYENTEGFDSQQKYKTLYDNTKATSQLWKVAPADIKNETDLFGGAAVAYNRGALALSVLRVLVGDDDFSEILKGWIEEYSGRAATTTDFIAFAETTADVDLTEFADEWLYDAAKPESFPTEQLPKLSYGISLSESGTHTFPAATAGYAVQQEKTVTVNNTGTKATGELTVTLSGNDSGSFTLSKASINSITSGGNDSFTVTPKTGLAAGTYTAIVTVSGENGISESFDVSFTVNAATYGVSLSQSGTYTFPAAAVGYPAQQAYSITVNNTGNQATGGLTVALSGNDGGSFTLSKASIDSIVVSGNDSFTITPKTGLAEGTYTATVAVSGGNNISAAFNVSFTVSAAPIQYSVLSDFTPFTGSGNVTARIDADVAKFVQLLHNGQVVDSQNYTVQSGSTIITFKESYLKTLDNGTHNFVAQFADGTADLTLNVNVQPEPVADQPNDLGNSDTNENENIEQSPQTGDNRNNTLWMLIGTASIAVIGIFTFEAKRRGKLINKQ